jgi:hypothetical protein
MVLDSTIRVSKPRVWAAARRRAVVPMTRLS